LAAAEKFRDLFYRVFELHLLQNAQKRDKKPEQNSRGRGEKKTEEQKARLFVMSPAQMEFFDFFPCF
jgi:hypothetical protein